MAQRRAGEARACGGGRSRRGTGRLSCRGNGGRGTVGRARAGAAATRPPGPPPVVVSVALAGLLACGSGARLPFPAIGQWFRSKARRLQLRGQCRIPTGFPLSPRCCRGNQSVPVMGESAGSVNNLRKVRGALLGPVSRPRPQRGQPAPPPRRPNQPAPASRSAGPRPPTTAAPPASPRSGPRAAAGHGPASHSRALAAAARFSGCASCRAAPARERVGQSLPDLGGETGFGHEAAVEHGGDPRPVHLT